VNGLAGFRALVGKELLEAVRTFRLPIVVGLFAVVGIGSPLLARFTPEIVEALAGDMGIPVPTPTVEAAIDQLLKNLAQFGGLTAILLAMGRGATEKERGTAALLLTKPVGRAAFLGAKVAALGLVLGLATAVAAIGGWIYTTILFEAPSAGGFAALAVLVWLSLFAYAAITFVASTVTRSALAAAGIGFVALVGLGIASAFPELGRYLPPGLGEPARALALGAGADVAVPVSAAVVLLVGCLVVSWGSFRRQEL
jgi:ABC-2 type transport system permease protein